jgi:hypothetical protein
MTCVGVLVAIVFLVSLVVLYAEILFPNWGKQRPSRHQARPAESDSDLPTHWSDKFLDPSGPLYWLSILVLAAAVIVFLFWIVEDEGAISRVLESFLRFLKNL